MFGRYWVQSGNGLGGAERTLQGSETDVPLRAYEAHYPQLAVFMAAAMQVFAEAELS